MSARTRNLVMSALLVSATVAATASEVRTISMQGTDTMKFSVERIEAAPGETVRVVLTTVSRMPKTSMAHNFVLLAPDVDPAAFVMEAAMASASGYLPTRGSERILAATALAGGGETVEVTFEAPTTPGEYAYICGFPGHFNGGMAGVLVVSDESS